MILRTSKQYGGKLKDEVGMRWSVRKANTVCTTTNVQPIVHIRLFGKGEAEIPCLNPFLRLKFRKLRNIDEKIYI